MSYRGSSIQLIDHAAAIPTLLFKLGRMSDLTTDEYIIARFEDDAFRQAMNDMWGVESKEIPVTGLLAKGLLLHSAEKDQGGILMVLIHGLIEACCTKSPFYKWIQLHLT
jgi:hypothetical protein